MFFEVQFFFCRHFYLVKLSGRFWPNVQVHLAEWRPENLATLWVNDRTQKYLFCTAEYNGAPPLAMPSQWRTVLKDNKAEKIPC
jgi:hypothetical protein